MADGYRHAIITPDDHGPILSIVSWVTMATTVLVVAVRLAVRISTGSAGLDDILAVVSMITAIGGTAAISVAVNDGLGQKDLVRDLSKTTEMQKSVYISSLLYLATLWLAKLSTISLISRLCAKKSQLHALCVTSGFTIAWGIAAIFADAFRCSLPKPYDLYGTKCINVFTFWNIISGIDAVSDLILILLPILLFGYLQMRFSRKLIVFTAFACRILVVIAGVARLVFLNTILQQASSDSLAFNAIPFQICTQVQQSLAIMAAAAPALKNFLDRAASGMLSASLDGLTGTTFGRDSYAMSNLNDSRGSASRSSRQKRMSEATIVATNISTVSRGSDSKPSKFNNFRPGPTSSATIVSGPQRTVKSMHGNHEPYQSATIVASDRPCSSLTRHHESRRGKSVDVLDAIQRGPKDACCSPMTMQVQRDWRVEHHRSLV